MADKTKILRQPGDGTQREIEVTENAAVLDLTHTWTANEPTAASTATIADGTVPTVAELGQAVANITAKLNLALQALRDHGIIA